MGEYALYRGERVKIGTCEEMYYLRADQARMVKPQAGSVDPVRDAEAIRFRFPFPWEDSREPGTYEDYDKRLAIHGLAPPTELADSHYSVQFSSTNATGYLTSLPCPESGKVPEGVRIARNGFPGAVGLVQQRLVDGQLLPILRCACGMAWRVSEEDSAQLIAAIGVESAADHHRAALSHRHHENAELPADWRSFWDDIADRVRQSYDREYVAQLFGRVLS